MLSEDGQSLVSCQDSIARIWALESGLRQQQDAHRDSVTGVSCSFDGTLVASCSLDRSVKLWSAASGFLVETFLGHSGGVLCVCFSSDGRYVASGSEDKSANVWLVSTGALLFSLEHERGVQQVGFSPDSLSLFTLSQGSPVKQWDLRDGSELRAFDASSHVDYIVCFAVSKNGEVASGSNGRIVIQNKDAEVVHEIEAHEGCVRSIAFNEDGTKLASGSEDCSCKVWDANDGALVAEIPHADPIMQVQFSSGNTLVTACRNNVITTFGTNFEEKENEITGNSFSLYNEIKVVADELLVKVVDNNGIVIWATRNYVLSLKASNITDAIELSERNKLLWAQHNKNETEEDSQCY